MCDFLKWSKQEMIEGRNSWIPPIKAINFEMTVLKTKQFNGIQFGSVRPDFLDYNYIGGHN